MKNIKSLTEKLVTNISQVIIGKDDAIEQVLICLLSRGHLLIEDVPGLGKTMLARSLARSINGSFGRIQFTPDMLPSDVTGVSIYNQSAKKFEFQPGPIMAEFVLADEINRATPKTQSALLEAMQENQVTVDGVTHALPQLFMVLATQNPIEQEGTFRLPEAQLDRFLMRVNLGYPRHHEEMEMLDTQQYQHPIHELEPILSPEDVIKAQNSVCSMYIAQIVKQYIVDIVHQTRIHPDLYLGASPRGSLGLYRAGQAKAAIHGRDFVIPDDIKSIATQVLGHRVILAPGAHLKNQDTDTVLEDILEDTPIPKGEYAEKNKES